MLNDDYQIIQFPSTILKKESEIVEKSLFNSPTLINFIEKMRIVKEDNGGFGLSAIQIGVNKRIIIVNEIIMINPKIIKKENETDTAESCLSIKGVFKKSRFNKIKVEYLDVHGIKHIATLLDKNAHCAQHEIDHLDGILINDFSGDLYNI